MKKIVGGTIVFFISFLLIAFIISSSTATPSKGDNCSSCHEDSGYKIEIDKTSVNTQADTEFTITVTATGDDLIVEAPDGAGDNDEFEFDESLIEDNDNNDDDSSKDEIEIEFKITSSDDEGEYTIVLIAREDVSSGKPKLVEIEITVIVGEGGVIPIVVSFFTGTFLDHFQIYLGGIALILLTIGTILVIIKENKFVRVHGILAGASFILTLINVILLFLLRPDIWTSFPLIFHWSHIPLGAIGLVTGFLSMMYGIAGERKQAKMTGYLTLICWWGAFVTGMLFMS